MRSANLFFFTQPQETFQEWLQGHQNEGFEEKVEQFFAEFQQIPINYGTITDTAYQDSLYWKEQHLYGSSRLGIAKPELEVTNYMPSNASKLTTNFRNYELTNHLGNVLSTIKDEKQQIDANKDGLVDYYEPIVITANDYYPFGMVMPNRSFSLAGSGYRFGFNGFEKDDEVKGVGNHISFGEYGLNTRLGRRFNIDPLFKKYPSHSSYLVFANNPILYLDPDGREIILVHGTWTNPNTWQNKNSIAIASNNLFGDKNMVTPFKWSGGNYTESRTEAALGLVNHAKIQMQSKTFNGEITLVGHSHGGNVSIEALNMMAKMKEFDNVQLNLLTINTPVRDDYQLSEKATSRVNHVNVYDPKDPIQSNGGNSTIVLPDLPRTPDFMDVNTIGTGEYGTAGRTFKKAKNIQVDNSQGAINGLIIWGGLPIPKKGDFHNSHNRVNDWIKKTKEK